MGWNYGFRPYVPVAQRRREAQRELEKKRKKGLDVLPSRTAFRAAVRTHAMDQSYTSRFNGAKSRPWSAALSFTQSRSRSHPCPTRIGNASRVSAQARSVRWSSSCKDGSRGASWM